MTQILGLGALALLYLTLLIGPLCFVVKRFPGKLRLFQARRPLGIAAFVLGCSHAGFAFFGTLKGFEGLSFVSPPFWLALGLGALALVVLAALAATAHEAAVRRLSFRRWKALHRLVYVAATAILAHALMIGSHFQSPPVLEALAFALLLGVLFLFQGLRFEAWVRGRRPGIPRGLASSLYAATGFLAALDLGWYPSLQLWTGS